MLVICAHCISYDLPHKINNMEIFQFFMQIENEMKLLKSITNAKVEKIKMFKNTKRIFLLVYWPSEDLAAWSECNGMQPTKSHTAYRIQMGIHSRHKQRIFMAKSKSTTISFAPYPELTIHEQRRVEEPTINSHLHGTTTTMKIIHFRSIGYWNSSRRWRNSERRGRNEEIGNWGRVETDLFDTTAELSRCASAPR